MHFVWKRAKQVEKTPSERARQGDCFCYLRNDDFIKIKLNLKKSGELWWKVGKNI